MPPVSYPVEQLFWTNSIWLGSQASQMVTEDALAGGAGAATSRLDGDAKIVVVLEGMGGIDL